MFQGGYKEKYKFASKTTMHELIDQVPFRIEVF